MMIKHARLISHVCRGQGREEQRCNRWGECGKEGEGLGGEGSQWQGDGASMYEGGKGKRQREVRQVGEKDGEGRKWREDEARYKHGASRV